MAIHCNAKEYTTVTRDGIEMKRYCTVNTRVSEGSRHYLDNLVGMKMAICKSEVLKTCVK